MLVACSLCFGTTARGQTLTIGTTAQPLPGSQFQGGDGDQTNAPGLIDWQGLQADGRVDHTSDPQANDNVFAGGSKELEPDGWGITTQNGGSTPASGNILDTYRSIDHPPGSDVFLYLAFTRAASNGTVYVTFELNQDAQLWRNSDGSLIPCRTTGDILISFDSHGNTADVEVDRWVTDTAALNGCARTGHLVSATNLTPNVDVQAAFNYSSAIVNYLPGFYNLSIPQLQFGEVAINLSTVLSGLGGSCAVFGSTWMHSRASLSDTAQMKDYVAPDPFHVRTCKADPDLSSSASGTVNRRARGKHRLRRHQALQAPAPMTDTAHLSGGDDPTGTIKFYLYGPNQRRCRGVPVFTDTATVIGNGYYQSGAFMPTRAGTYRWVVKYSGDGNNQPAGPTRCGDDTETVVVDRADPSLTSSASGTLQRSVPGGALRLAGAPPSHQIYDIANLEGGFSPIGKITFRLYGPDDADCSGHPIFRSRVTVNGTGTYRSRSFTVPRAGTYRWVVSYSGDRNNNPQGPTACGIGSETTVINPAEPTISTVASGAVTLGAAIRDTATLTGGADPTGSITFDVYGPDDDMCTGPSAQSSTVRVRGNGRYRSRRFSPTVAGTYRWVAKYSGDDDNAAAGPTDCSDPGEAVVVGHPVVQPDLASTASTSTPAGSLIYDTAHLSSGSDPTGAITFEVYGPDDDSCAAPAAGTSSVTVSGNGDYTSASFVPTDVGTYRWIVSYSGDDRNLPAGPTDCTDANETVVVSKATPALRTVAFAVVPLGGAVRDKAFLSGGSQPGGTITFLLYGPNDPSCSSPPVFTTRQNVTGNGAYSSARFVPRAAGTYLWVASYSGDANNNAVATACGGHSEAVRVLRRQPLLTTSASPPANVTTAPRVRAGGLEIYDAATLSSGSRPTGSIKFALFGPDDPSCSAPPVFTSFTLVNGNGVYNSDRFTPTASGVYRWVATYSGDANNRAAGPTGCGVAAEQVTVTLPATLQLTSSASGAVTIGGAIYDTAHLSGGAAPTGTLTFRLYAPVDTGCTGNPVFTSTVKVAGNDDYVSQSFVPTAVGVHRWVVNYSGDAANNPAGPTACDDSAESVVVRPPNIFPEDVSISTQAGQQPPGGASLYDTAFLSGGISPGGTITFTLFGPDDQTCSGPPAFTTTVAVTGNGNYRSTAFTVPVEGTYRWVITYSGDAMNAPFGPTACGQPAETSTVSSNPSPSPDPGPDVPTPPKPPPQPTPPKPPPQPTPSPPPPAPAPIVTG